jgi:hypothetical protein
VDGVVNRDPGGTRLTGTEHLTDLGEEGLWRTLLFQGLGDLARCSQPLLPPQRLRRYFPVYSQKKESSPRMKAPAAAGARCVQPFANSVRTTAVRRSANGPARALSCAAVMELSLILLDSRLCDLLGQVLGHCPSVNLPGHRPPPSAQRS